MYVHILLGGIDDEYSLLTFAYTRSRLRGIEKSETTDGLRKERIRTQEIRFVSSATSRSASVEKIKMTTTAQRSPSRIRTDSRELSPNSRLDRLRNFILTGDIGGNFMLILTTRRNSTLDYRVGA